MFKKILIFQLTFAALTVSAAQQNNDIVIEMNNAIQMVKIPKMPKTKIIRFIANATNAPFFIDDRVIEYRSITKVNLPVIKFPKFMVPPSKKDVIDLLIYRIKNQDTSNKDDLYIAFVEFFYVEDENEEEQKQQAEPT